VFIESANKTFPKIKQKVNEDEEQQNIVW